MRRTGLQNLLPLILASVSISRDRKTDVGHCPTPDSWNMRALNILFTSCTRLAFQSPPFPSCLKNLCNNLVLGFNLYDNYIHLNIDDPLVKDDLLFDSLLLKFLATSQPSRAPLHGFRRRLPRLQTPCP